MKELENKILKDGKVLPGGILKVDNFLNHQIDSQMMYKMAVELKTKFNSKGVNKVLTVEASGIAFAIMVAYVFECPMLFAKKEKTKNISDNLYKAEVPSYTHGNVNTICVSKDYLGKEDKVLIVDDFLATGAALKGMISICEQANAEVIGCGIAVEKVFQGGGNELRARGITVESLAKVSAMSETSLEFED